MVVMAQQQVRVKKRHDIIQTLGHRQLEDKHKGRHDSHIRNRVCALLMKFTRCEESSVEELWTKAYETSTTTTNRFSCALPLAI